MKSIKRGVARAGWACAGALGYGRDEPQRSGLDRRLRLARLYWPSLARSIKSHGFKVREVCCLLLAWTGMGAGFAGASVWSFGAGWALGAALATGAGQMAIARWLFLAPAFESRNSARRALTGPGGRFEGYLDRSMAERSKIAARQMGAVAAQGKPRARRAPRL